MDTQPPTKTEWQQLYDLMPQIKKLAPWEFMNEDMIFGVQNPATGEYGFVSVMGNLGEHLSIAVYLGARALYDFWAIHNEEMDPMHILEIPQLQASFEDREMVTPEDRGVMKQLGRKFRGRQAWPLFRSYCPGYVPWYLTQAEVQFLAHALAQTLDVAQRVRENPALLIPAEDVTYLVRVPTIAGDALVWRDQMLQIPPPEMRTINIMMDMEALEFVKTLSPRKLALEVDFFMTPAQIQENKAQRPFFAYSLLAVDLKSGMILGAQMMAPDSGFDDMLGQVPVEMLYILADTSLRPESIHVQSPRLQGLLNPLCQELGIALKYKPLRELERAKASFLAFMRR